MGIKVDTSGLDAFSALLGDIIETQPKTNRDFMAEDWNEFMKAALPATRYKTHQLQQSFEPPEITQTENETSAEFVNSAPYATWINDGIRLDPRTGNIIYLKSTPDHFWEAGLMNMALTQAPRYMEKFAKKFK